MAPHFHTHIHRSQVPGNRLLDPVVGDSPPARFWDARYVTVAQLSESELGCHFFHVGVLSVVATTEPYVTLLEEVVGDPILDPFQPTGSPGSHRERECGWLATLVIGQTGRLGYSPGGSNRLKFWMKK